MQQYKADFIEFMVTSGALSFGDFVTKSGRRTPFFINTGRYDDGVKMIKLGAAYAQALLAKAPSLSFNSLYGPAYKGISLVVATSMALAINHGATMPYTFNRKEVKDHGEGGALVGHALKSGDRVVVIEDVVTAGTSIRETLALLEPLGVQLTGVMVSVDRQERGEGSLSALQELRERYGIWAEAIVTLDEIVEYLHGRELNGRIVLDDAMAMAITAYRELYGC